VPTAGVIFIDLKEMKNNGKIFGLDIPTGKAVNFRMGALGKIRQEKYA